MEPDFFKLDPEPCVSVIIPCFNAERHLPETLESVFFQSMKNYEIILIDDGSVDRTKSLIQSYGNKVKALFCRHEGASVARNQGTKIARGVFIQYLDSDDRLRPAALEERVRALSATDADVAYGDWQKLVRDSNGCFIPGEIVARRIEDVHPDPEIALLTDFWAPPAALLYRRRIVKKIGLWNESLPVIQDARFLLDAALRGGRFVYVPGVGADYRVTGGNSLSRKNQRAFIEDVFRNARQVEAWWRARDGLSTERARALAKTYDYTARSLFSMDEELFEENLMCLYRVEPGFRLSWPKIAGLAAIIFGQRSASRFMRWIGKPGPIEAETGGGAV